MKTKLNRNEVTMLVNAQLMSKITADKLKAVKEQTKTAELASTAVGENNGRTVHNPYKADGIGEIQVIDSVRETVDTTALIAKLGALVDTETLNAIVAECTKVSDVHTVNIKADKSYAVDFERRVNAGLELLDTLDAMKEEVRQKVLAMVKKAQAN